MNLGSFRILLPFFRTSWGVGVLNSEMFNSFHKSGWVWHNFGGPSEFRGGGLNTPNPPSVRHCPRHFLRTDMAATPLHHEDRMQICRTFCHTAGQTTNCRQLRSLPQKRTVSLLSTTCGTMLIWYHPNRKFRYMGYGSVTFTFGALKMIAVPSIDTARKRISLIYKYDILLQFL